MVEDMLTRWLLESTIPTIRYRTLSELLDRPPDDAEVVAARDAIMTDGPVPVILGKQLASGNWDGQPSFYTYKYVSAHWSMLLLEELDADGEDERFRAGADFMLDAPRALMHERLDDGRMGWSCLFANIIRYVARAGLLNDERAQEIIHYLALDLGNGRSACEYNYGEPCGWGAARTLWGLAAIPPEQRSPEVQKAIEVGLSFLLDEFSLVNYDYPTGEGRPHPLWARLNFPLFYQADILFALRALADLGALDHAGAQPALDWLASRRKKNGRWPGSSPYRGRTYGEIAGGDETNRWVSLHCATVLRQAGRMAHDDVRQPA